MPTPRQIAKIAVNKILEDLTDRRGLRQAWEAIDDSIRTEIRAEWEQIIREAASEK